MQSQLKSKWDYYLPKKSKLIYAKNRVLQKTFHDLELCSSLNFISFFIIINNLFNYFKDIFSNFYQNQLAMKKVSELNIRASLFDNF